MKVNYPQTILVKSTGLNTAEEYLSRLCKDTFLSLWSYPNVFRDQGRTNASRKSPKGDGKEVCDLLVVFENHLIIFSDKQCAFSRTGDIELDWSRWYRKAVKKAANQIWGAERWIFNEPNKLYLDKSCTQPFPLSIPPRENTIVHRIVVAHGASAECIKQLGGTGTLMINPQIIGDMHIKINNSECYPFTIGKVEANKGYVHVFDDISLEIVMRTLDTISDFTTYLTKKEHFISSGKLVMVTGEDDLLAYYLKHVDKHNEHTFLEKSNKEIKGVVILEGLWEEFSKNPLRLAQIKANEISYSWDKLIEKFIFHVTTGTSYRMSHPDLQSQEKIFRVLAKENRTRRRMLAEKIHKFIAKTPKTMRATQLIMPSNPGDPYYLFLLLPKPKNISNEKYRKIRGELLNSYLRITKLNSPNALDIVGLATETGWEEKRSEDIMYLDARTWTQEENNEAKRLEEELIKHRMLGKRQIFRTKIKEYPDENPPKVKIGMKGSERNMPCPCGSGRKFKNCCGKYS